MRLFRKIQLLTFIFLLVSLQLYASDSLLMSQLLNRIDQLQCKQNGVFPKGLFPTYRMYALNKDRQKADVNIFFTGLIAFTLEDIQPQLTISQQNSSKQIIANTLPVYAKFKNQKGKSIYNFWPTDTPQIFPNSGWMNIFNKSQALPDDLDDTVIMLLAQNASVATAKQVHDLMQSFINTGNKKINNTFKDYQELGAYSTWFGVKMPVDFDICVLTNILYFVQKYNLTWTAADTASLQLIEKVLIDKKHVTDAAYISPHYGKLPIILYHISRLMSLKPLLQLENFKQQLINEAKTALANTSNFMDQVILSTSLMRWGVKPPDAKVLRTSSLLDLIENESFYFCNANIANMMPNPLKQWITGAGLGMFYYYCPAYNNLLLLENLAWRKKRNLN